MPDLIRPRSTVGESLTIIDEIRYSESRIGVLTSGSTGPSKIVWHQMSTMIRGIVEGERHQADVWGLAYHPAHFAGLQVFFQAVVNQNPIVRLFGLDGSDIQHAIESESISHISATPTFLRLICSLHSHVYARVSRITVGGERLDEMLRVNLARVFPNAKCDVYASTEAGTVLLSDGESFKIPFEKLGVVKLIDGQLAIHHSLLAESFRAALEKRGSLVEGFFLTGDLVEPVGNEGAFRFLPRHDLQINVGGYKVNSLDVENALRQLSGIADTTVYGIDNSVTGVLLHVTWC